MSIGEKLRTERERKGYTLDDVHSRLRIHPSILSNLEQNNFQALPAAIYTKGFLKRYSEFLEINADEMLSEYDSLKIKHRELSLQVGLQKTEKVGDPVVPPSLMPAKEPLKTTNLRRSGGRGPGLPAGALIRAALVVAGVAVIVFAAWKSWEFLAAVGSRMSAPRAPAHQAARVPQAAPQRPAVPSNLILTPQAGNFPKIKASVPLGLSITASTDAWVRVTADGQNVFEAILRPGQTKEWTAQNVFELKLGRPAGVTLSLNGYSLGSPDNGQAKQVVITREGMARMK